MKIANYIRLANISNKLLSWLCIFGFIGSYIRFMGYGFGILAISFLIYMAFFGIYLYIRWKKFNKPQMSYVIHPLYFGAVIIGFFITAVESTGADMDTFLVYVVFLIALYMVNCYISAFTIKISSATASKASTMIKYSVKQNIMFVIWLAAFILAGILVIFIPTSGIGAMIIAAIRLLFGKKSISGQGEGEIDSTYVEEEASDNDMGGEPYEENTLLALVLAILIISLVVLIIYLARKIFAKADKPMKFAPEVNYDIIEEVSDIKENKKVKQEKETPSGGSEAKIRRYFAKTVNSYHEKINASKTPSELLEKGLEGESELTEIYESVRYSEEKPGSEEVKRAKELSSELIKRVGKR